MVRRPQQIWSLCCLGLGQPVSERVKVWAPFDQASLSLNPNKNPAHRLADSAQQAMGMQALQVSLGYLRNLEDAEGGGYASLSLD